MLKRCISSPIRKVSDIAEPAIPFYPLMAPTRCAVPCPRSHRAISSVFLLPNQTGRYSVQIRTKLWRRPLPARQSISILPLLENNACTPHTILSGVPKCGVRRLALRSSNSSRKFQYSFVRAPALQVRERSTKERAYVTSNRKDVTLLFRKTYSVAHPIFSMSPLRLVNDEQ